MGLLRDGYANLILSLCDETKVQQTLPRIKISLFLWLGDPGRRDYRDPHEYSRTDHGGFCLYGKPAI